MVEKIRLASLELGKEITITTHTDPAELASFGITRGPAVVTVNYRLKSEGAEPSVEVVREWLKEL